jgi:DeoR family transcriptional regulator, suf operon transcriptional repressor
MGSVSLAETHSPTGNRIPGPHGLRGEILAELKRSPGVTVRQLAGAAGASLNAVRRYLRELEDEGLIEHQRQHKGVGAPVFTYRLSSAGESLFPRRYEATLLALLDRLVEREGRAAAVTALEEQFDGLAQKLKPETAGLMPADRLAAVAKAMAEEGYMAESAVTGDSFGTLIEHNCAIQAVAERFPEVCVAEERFLEAVLGKPIERRGHILAGCGCCEYRVRFNALQRAAEEST